MAAWPTLALFLLQRVFAILFYVGANDDHSTDGLLRWDAGWYRQVATDGYDTWPKYTPTGEATRTNLAFFPLFPLAGRALAALTPLDAGSALLVLAWIGSLVGAWGVFAVGNHLGGRWAGAALALAWGASPQSMVLVMGYPEGWLTAAIAFALLFLLTDRPVPAGLACLFAGLLQPASLPLVAVIALWAFIRAIRSARAGGPSSERREYLLAGALAPAGMLAVMVGIALRTGRPFGYFAVQADWGSEMGSPLTFITTMHEQVFLRQAGVPRSAIYAPIIIGYLILLALLVGQLNQALSRDFVWVVAYTALATLLVLANQDFFHSIPRHFLPVFTLLIPVALLRTSRVGAGLALAVASVGSTWWGAYYIVHSTVSI
jgi:hypothetical protein